MSSQITKLTNIGSKPFDVCLANNSDYPTIIVLGSGECITFRDSPSYIIDKKDFKELRIDTWK